MGLAGHHFRHGQIISGEPPAPGAPPPPAEAKGPDWKILSTGVTLQIQNILEQSQPLGVFAGPADGTSDPCCGTTFPHRKGDPSVVGMTQIF